jgi:hypothetical protein
VIASSRKVVCVLLVALLALLSTGWATQKGAENEPELLIKSAKFLEDKPFDKDAHKVREWALKWLIETDKVSVKICPLFLDGVGRKYKYSVEVTAQYTIGMGAFKLAHPEKAGNEDEAQQAGVDSVLAFYESMLKEQPKAKEVFLDSLLAKRADGTLAQFVLANNCKGK